MKKTILITGGTGFVGSYLVPKLIAEGHNVKVLTTGNSKEFKGAKCYQWNLLKSELDPEAIKGVTDVIHLAGASISKKWTSFYKQEIVDSRTLGPRLIVEHLAKNKQKLNSFISASGISIYPDSKEWATEESEHAESFIGNVCKQWESAADLATGVSQRIVKLRIGIVLEKDNGALVPMLKATRMGVGSAQGSGQQFISWIHIVDLVNVFLWASNNESINGVFNTTAPNPETNSVFMKELAKAAGRPILAPKVPAFVLKLLLGEMSTLVLTSNRVSSEKLTSHGFKFEYDHLTEALQATLKR
ncbi:MAG: TIGR01777 family oxidoreductase [Schleiferiaceae bacterium]|nr:TIGR01777 family oxidoreductase [Schleiferiaceae bacterium]